MNAKQMALEALKFAYNDCESDYVRDQKIDPAIAAIEAELAQVVEPVAWAAQCSFTKKYGYIWHEEDDVKGWIHLQHQSRDDCTYCGPIPLYAAPPEPVNAELLEALHKLACLGNGDSYGNSIGNVIAQDAIAKATGATT